jgi:hypothetical protein
MVVLVRGQFCSCRTATSPSNCSFFLASEFSFIKSELKMTNFKSQVSHNHTKGELLLEV